MVWFVIALDIQLGWKFLMWNLLSAYPTTWRRSFCIRGLNFVLFMYNLRWSNRLWSLYYLIVFLCYRGQRKLLNWCHTQSRCYGGEKGKVSCHGWHGVMFMLWSILLRHQYWIYMSILVACWFSFIWFMFEGVQAWTEILAYFIENAGIQLGNMTVEATCVMLLIVKRMWNVWGLW